MKKMRNAFLLISCLFALLLLFGCHKSFDVFYTANAPLAPNSSALQKFTIGIAKFEDKRTYPIDGEKDIKNESFVAKEKGWKYGCTYKNNDYAPVKNIVQDILVQEFTMAGLKAIPLDIVMSKDNMQNASNPGNIDSVDFILGGQLLVLNFNMNGMGHISNGILRQREDTVTLNLNIFDKNSMKLISDQDVDQKDVAPPMVVINPFVDSHATCVNDLVNETFREVAHQIISTTAKTIAEASAQN